MSEEQKHDAAVRLKRYVNNARGDDLYRARAAFRHLTSEELDSPYGQSGHTCRQILEGYEQGERDWQEANRMLENMLRKEGL